MHLISTSYRSPEARVTAEAIKRERERPADGEFCYNPNSDCPQPLDVSWLAAWMTICKSAKRTGGNVYVVYRSDGQGQYGCRAKGSGSLDGQAQEGEILYAMQIGCPIVWVDSCGNYANRDNGCTFNWVDSTHPEDATAELSEQRVERLRQRVEPIEPKSPRTMFAEWFAQRFTVPTHPSSQDARREAATSPQNSARLWLAEAERAAARTPREGVRV